MLKYALASLLTVFMLFSSAAAYAGDATGFLFLEGTQSDKNFKMTAQPIKNSWRTIPGGFFVKLQGGHTFFYKKLPNKSVKLTLHRKIGNSIRVYKSHYTKAKARGMSYTFTNGTRKLQFLRTYHVSKAGVDRNQYFQIRFKKGSVLFKK